MSTDSFATPEEDHGEADCAPTAHGGPHTAASECTERKLLSLKNQSMQEQALPHVEDPYWSSLFLKLCTLWYGPIAEAILEELQSVGRSHDRTVHEGLYPMGRTPSWSRAKDDEQGVVEKNS